MKEQGNCPVCNGTKRRPATDEDRHYGIEYGWWGYDKDTDTFNCNNCGSQYMYGEPTGKVNLRKDDGKPCVHSYEGHTIGRCLIEYICKYCDDRYEVDSSD